MKKQLWLALAAFLVCGAPAFGGDEGKKEEGKKDAPKVTLPEGVRGFAGVVKGTVEKKLDRGIALKVTEVVKTWEANKATDPKALVGQTIKVTAARVKVEGQKKLRPNELQMAFLRTLEVGKEVTLEVKHLEREFFAILELSKEQIEAAKNAKTPAGDTGEKKPGGDTGEKKPGGDAGEKKPGGDTGEKKPEQPKEGGEF